jgi:hypothetical protein
MGIIALVLIAVTAAIFGGLVGWFLRGRLYLTALICIITPIIFLAAFGLSTSEGRSGVKADPAGVIIWDIIPLLFLTVPCLIGGLFMDCLAHRAKKGSGEIISK